MLQEVLDLTAPPESKTYREVFVDLLKYQKLTENEDYVFSYQEDEQSDNKKVVATFDCQGNRGTAEKIEHFFTKYQQVLVEPSNFTKTTVTIQRSGSVVTITILSEKKVSRMMSWDLD